MRFAALFGLVALFPAAVNAASVPVSGVLVPLCTGDGQVHMVRVPMRSPGAPGGKDTPCCNKGCHAGSSRKRGSSCHFDTSQ